MDMGIGSVIDVSAVALVTFAVCFNVWYYCKRAYLNNKVRDADIDYLKFKVEELEKYNERVKEWEKAQEVEGY